MPDKPVVRKRELPWCNRDPKRYVELPMGNFVVQPVGSTSYCRGLHVHTHLAGEEESVSGVLSFGAHLETDGTVTWHRQQLSYVVRHDRADEILVAALGLSRSWYGRDPTHCTIYYLDLAVEERLKWYRKMRAETHTQEHLAKLLADPEAPRTHNVKNDDGEWVRVPHTEEERIELRELWKRNLQRAVGKLARIHAEADARIVQLKSIEARCHAFIRKESDRLQLPFEAVGST